MVVCLAVAGWHSARAGSPVIVQNQAGFEGLEEATVIYFPDTNTFQNDPTNFPNHVDLGGGLFRDTLRNYYPTQGWWDGDRATTNTDRQRTEAKGITGLGHQFVDQTFEYSFDFRANPGFSGTSHFCDFFQLKALDGNNGPPLVAGALYKNGNTTYMRFDSDGDGRHGTVGTFSFTAGQWYHISVRITPCLSSESIGQVTASVDGSNFVGYTNSSIYLSGSTEYRPKFGFYRGIGTGYGVPAGDSWFEHRTVTGYIGSRNVLNWKGGLNLNTWDSGTTQNFLNGSSPSAFTLGDIVNFNDSTTNTTVNLAGAVAPEFVRVSSSQNYTFTGSGSLASGTLRKEGSGTLTLATTNSYMGLTDVRAGVLYVTGSIGNNSLVSLTGGTLRAGSNTALGTSSTIGTTINGGALDINGFNLTTEPIAVQGSGIGGAGAIINTGPQQTSALTKVTLTGDTTLGGTGRWDIRGSGASLGTAGASFNLTKTGANQISLVGASVDPALGNITINQGVLAFQTSTSSMGDPSRTVTINSGGALNFFNTSNTMNKLAVLNGGTIWAESGIGSQNTFAGAITLNTLGGTLDSGGPLTGGSAHPDAVLNITGNITGPGSLIKSGPGTATLSGLNTYTGPTIVTSGKLSLRSSAKDPVLSGAGADIQNGRLVLDYSDTGTPPDVKSILAADFTASPRFSTGQLRTSNPADPSKGLGWTDDPAAQQITIAYTFYGDTNLDGQVDVSDLGALATSWQSSNDWSGGDFNYDGFVDVSDLGILATNWQAGVGNSLAGADSIDCALRTAGLGNIVIPEPAAPTLLLFGLSIAGWRRSRRITH
jgi:autotransporter-associated beta strand protein